MHSKRLLYLQLLFTALAFLVMVVLSYYLTSKIVRNHVVRSSEDILTLEKEKIEMALQLPETVLNGFSETVRHMIMRGDDMDSIRKYVEALSDVLIAKDQRLVGFDGVYGYFETLDGKTAFVHGESRIPPEDYDPKTRPWYTVAIEAEDGFVAQVLPYQDEITHKFVFTYARCIRGDDNRLLGVACLTLLTEGFGKEVVDTANRHGAIGMLISNDLTIVSHSNSDFVGKKLGDPSVPISVLMGYLLNENVLSQREFVNYEGKKSVAFSRKLSNGWYLALVIPTSQYYQSVTNLALTLSLLGTVLTAVLMGFLIRIDAARTKADEESKIKSSFLANMSHEIRTPMNAIIGMTTLGKSASDMDRKDFCLTKIEEASQHLLGVINNILDISKIEAGKFELSVTEFYFERMLQNVVNIVNHRVVEKRLTFNLHIDNSIPPKLIGDDQRLAQVITNLLGNAVKFTPEGETITLDTRLVEQADDICTIQIAVSDTGIGVSREQQAHLFNAFHQAESGTVRHFGGTGLGLAISKNIVDMMGGTIGVESEPGEGATFVFTVRVKQATSHDSSVVNQNIHWENVSVMVIDDDPAVLDYFTEIMQRTGTFCDIAASGEEALALVEKHGAYNIYFVDWKMPGMDGITLTRRLKEKTTEPDRTVVIMISAAEWSEIESEAKQAGVDNFLSKPLFPSMIMDAISKSLGIPLRSVTKKPQEDLSGIFSGYCALLAEDVKINSMILQGLLEPTELEIDCAENGAVALQKFIANPKKYNLIFMDVQMPVMDGHEATRQIRALNIPNAKTIPIIAMTANVFREDVEECLHSGMDSHLGKPLNFDEVLSQLRHYLGTNAGA